MPSSIGGEDAPAAREQLRQLCLQIDALANRHEYDVPLGRGPSQGGEIRPLIRTKLDEPYLTLFGDDRVERSVAAGEFGVVPADEVVDLEDHPQTLGGLGLEEGKR
jgi:hypothetical protein